jgi:hypothetical protein
LGLERRAELLLAGEEALHPSLDGRIARRRRLGGLE